MGKAKPLAGVPGFALAGDHIAWMRKALREAGGLEVPVEEAEGLLWAGGSAAALENLLDRGPRVKWVQLPVAGIEEYVGLIGDARIWTAAKGVFADHVAECVLGLAISGFRHLYEGVGTKSWRRMPGATLYNCQVTIVGGGGITVSLLRLLAPFNVRSTVVRRHQKPLSGAQLVLTPDRLEEGLRTADLVVLALPLTGETQGMFAEAQLHAMKRDAWLINVGRGKLLVTDHLVRALRDHWIGGAGLDVTDPEPLPKGHVLWQMDNCIITSHSSNPPNLERDQLTMRITENVRRYLKGQALLGVVDPELGY